MSNLIRDLLRAYLPNKYHNSFFHKPLLIVLHCTLTLNLDSDHLLSKLKVK